MFGANNYGEIPHTLNHADGDPWDVLVPGYKTLKKNKPYLIKKIEGIIILSNGNHKIICDIHHTSSRSKSWKSEVNTYATNYQKYMNKKYPNLKLFIVNRS